MLYIPDYEFHGWTRLTDVHKFNQIPFGVYSLTAPLTEKPSDRFAPYELADTVYIGMSGNSYDSYSYDLKSTKGGNRFKMYSTLHSRLKQHRKNLLNNNKKGSEKERSYQQFFEQYGYGSDVVERVYVNVTVPKVKIPDDLVPAWTNFMENFFIYNYALKFGSVPLMNIAHNKEKMHQMKVDDDSISRKKYNMDKSFDLSVFM